MINFNDLPGDIKKMIYNINKEEDIKKHNKLKYNCVIDSLKCLHDPYDTGPGIKSHGLNMRLLNFVFNSDIHLNAVQDWY